MSVFSEIAIVLLTKLTSWLFAKGLESVHGSQQKASTDEDIEKRLAGLKAAYKEAFNGKPVTPEERKKLNNAVADFIRNPSNGGL